MREPALDAIKWIALVTMTLDHLRFVWPVLEFLSWPGRFAFPAFALVMAAHAARQGQPGASAWRQMAWLVGFAVVSQWPYWLLFEREQGNIMLTLACGLGLICGLRMTGWRGTLIAVVSIAIPLVIPASYGLPGVILSAAFLVALQGGKKVSWALPAAVAAVAQGDLLHAALAAAASVALLALLSTRCRARVWPVGRWAYGYYPAHLLLLAALAP
jgi:hypothetical protein